MSAKDLNVGFLKNTEIQMKRQLEGINRVIMEKIREGEEYIKHNWIESTEEVRDSVKSNELLSGFLSMFGGSSSKANST